MHSVMLLVALNTVTDAPVQPAAVKSDVVLQWNEVVLAAIRADKTAPPLAARNLAMVHAAIYDGVNAVYQTHQSYRVARTPADPVEPAAVAAIAAHRILVELYPGQVDRFDSALDDTMANVPVGNARTRGVRLGQEVAEKMLAWRATDGSRRRVAYRPMPAIGVWRPTPPGYKAALLPQWPSLKPFAVRAATAFRPVAPPALTSAEYTKDFNEVKSLGYRHSRTRTADQTLIALFWDDGAGTSTPPGHWNTIARVVARQQGNSLAENARLFALLNLSLADAAIACWDCKYKYGLWRPVTAIREADRDGNPDTLPDRAWTPLLTTPPFPSYTSGHSTFSGAAATALGYFYGTDAVRFTVGSEGLRGAKRSYAGFWDAANEAGRSRIYGGIHYECDNREGLAAGKAIALAVCRNWLAPRPEPVARSAAWRRPARR
jgi:hypothetical protein